MMSIPVWVRKPTAKQVAFFETCDTWEHVPDTWEVTRADNYESFIVLAGRAFIEMENGDRYRFTVGDLVTMAPGIKCTWCVEEHIKKHFAYNIDLEDK